MQLIAEISEKNFNPDYTPQPNLQYSLRKAARAILKYNNQIALLYVSNKNYHKLPGGGIEGGEDIHEALGREIKEETGCEANIQQELGVTIEYRDQINQIQISYIFIAEVIGTPSESSFTDDEKLHGFILKWVDIDQTEKIMQQDNPTNPVDKFINFRDKQILNHYMQR